MPNIPEKAITSTEKVKKFFSEYYSAPLEFPSNEVDAVVGFFESRGFEKLSAQTIGAVLMRQAKIDSIKVFELLDTLKGFDEIQLSQIATSKSKPYPLFFCQNPFDRPPVTVTLLYSLIFYAIYIKRKNDNNNNCVADLQQQLMNNVH